MPQDLDQEPEEVPDDELHEEPVDELEDDLGDPEDDSSSPESNVGDEPVQQDSTPSTPDWHSPFAEFGINGIPTDPRLFAQQYAQERQSFAEQARQAQYWQMQAYAAQQQRQAPVQQPEQKKPTRQVPEYDPQWLNYVTEDADGNLVAKPGVQPDLPQKIRAFQQFQRQEAESFLTDPTSYIDKHYGDQIEERARKIASEAVRQSTLQQQAQQIAQQIEPWAFARDAQGRVLQDPMTGQKQVSPAGNIYWREVQRLGSMGIVDPNVQNELAQNAVYAAMHQWQQTQQAPETNPQVQQAAQQQAILRGGARQQQAQPRKPNGEFTKKKSIGSDREFESVLKQRLMKLPREGFRDN